MQNRTLTKEEKSMYEALVLACKYSFDCEKARSLEVSENLLKFATGKENNSDKIMKELMRLEPYKFYRQIAEMNDIENPFDLRIIKFYWIGTPNLKGDTHNYTTNIPLARMPMGHIRQAMINECLIHPAQVQSVQKKNNTILLKYRPVVKKEKALMLSKKNTEKEVKNIFLKKILPGDYLTIHFSTPIEKITKKQFQNLIENLHASLKKFNQLHKKFMISAQNK